MDVRKIRDDDGLEYVVNFEWDDEAKVWIATSDDIDGLVLESESLDHLMQRVRIAAPELIEQNHLPIRPRCVFPLTAVRKWLSRNHGERYYEAKRDRLSFLSKAHNIVSFFYVRFRRILSMRRFFCYTLSEV